MRSGDRTKDVLVAGIPPWSKPPFLLDIFLGNRFTLEKVNDVRIERDDGQVVRKSMYKTIQQGIGTGGMIDGQDML